jgi:hypothetical protein
MIKAIRSSYWVAAITLPHGGGSCTGGRDTAAEALADAVRDSTYYLGNYPSIQVELSEHCNNCSGRGEVRGKRKFSWKPCPVCKGSPLFQQIGPVPVTAHDNVKVVATC